MQPIINPHIANLRESATLAINQAALQARRAGEAVCHFGFGQSPFEVHPHFQQALANNTHQKDYLPTQGLPALREAIANFHGAHFGYQLDPAYILVGPGSKELIFQTLFVLEGEVIVPAPSWVSYGPQVNIRGKEIVPVVTRRENRYILQPEELAATCEAIGNSQKVLILNNPSNPTGAIYSDREVRDLAEVCRRYRVVVISDEIYAQVNFSGRPYTGFSQYYPEGTIITGGLSKAQGAGGYRMGFLACPPNMDQVIKALAAMISETFSAVASPIQHASLHAYSGDPAMAEYVSQCTRIHGAAGHYLWRRFEDMGLNCPRPEGAFYLFPDFNNYQTALQSRGIGDSVQLSQHLFGALRVAVLPGSDFYYPREYLGVRVASVDYPGGPVYAAALESELDDNFVEQHCPNLREGCDRLQTFLREL
jgi:aspartate/methionine/tyrosine aminotransferase